MNKKILILVIVSFFSLSSCKKGKNLKIGDSIQFVSKNLTEDYKLFIYIDKNNCTPCSFPAQDWKIRIRELQKQQNKLGVYFIVHEKEYQEFKNIFEENNLIGLILLDKGKKFYKKNNISSETFYHIFLVDQNNKVLMMGNPIGNDNLWQQYKEKIKQS